MIFLFFLPVLDTVSAKTLRFGVISTVDRKIVEERFRPLLEYLSKKTGDRYLFDTGRDYDDTIERFIDGRFDLGYIGPSPYILASRKAPGALRILVGAESEFSPYFHAVIVARKSSSIESLRELAGGTFAFGSRRSTLSFYLPYYMLMEAGVIGKLARYDFLGRHDTVAKNVIMATYEAGGIKESVARTYRPFLKVLARSEPVVDFAIVVHRSMDRKKAEEIRKALLELKDPHILQAIKGNLTGFGPRKESDYDRLREIMQAVEADLSGSEPAGPQTEVGGISPEKNITRH